MSLQRILKFDIRSIANFLSDSKETISDKTTTVPNELQGLLSNNEIKSSSLIDVSERESSIRRIDDIKVQSAIKNFNNLSKDEKLQILENADTKLQDKLNTFIVRNLEYEQVNTELSTSFNKFSERISYMLTNNAYDENEINDFWNELDFVIKNCYDNLDYVSDTFLQYRGREILYDKKISLTDKANYAVTKSANLKQTLASYVKLIKSKLREIHRASIGKADIMQEIVTIVARIQTITEVYQSDSAELMDSYVTYAINEENNFCKNIEEYAAKGISNDISLENKVIENAILDAVVEATKHQGVIHN